MRPLVDQLRPRRTEKEDRSVACPVGEMLEQVEQRRLGPVDVVDDENQRPLARTPLERLPDRPEDLLRRLPTRARRRARLGARLAEDLDERPVGDAFAVREAAAETGLRRPSSAAAISRASRDLPIPGGPSTVTSWQRRSGKARRRPRALRPALPAARRAGRRAAARRQARPRRPAGAGRREGLRFPLTERLDRLDLDRAAGEPDASARRSGSRPAARPARVGRRR